MAVSADHFEPRYLHFVLSQIDLGELSNPGPVPSVNESAIGALKVKFAPMHDQVECANRIDRELSKVRSLISANTRQVELLQELRQALITSAVTGQLEI